MSKLTIMKGLPASGKSTKAKEILEKGGNAVRINKDLLRTMLHFDKFSPKKEKLTQIASQGLARIYLKQGVNVIIDDTNLNPKVLDEYKAIAKETDSKIEYIDMTDIPVPLCVARDDVREKKVGAHVIYRMALQYLDYMKGRPIIVSDLDGTLCDVEHRRHFVRGDKKDWNSFFNGISGDSIRQEVVDKISNAQRTFGNIDLVLVSARPERCRADTEAWLAKHGIEYTLLLMRADNDSRDDTIVKSEIFDKYLSKMDIKVWYDDRPKVIRAIREKGVVVVDVGNGEEF